MKKTKIKFENKHYMVPTYMIKMLPLAIPVAILGLIGVSYAFLFLLECWA